MSLGKKDISNNISSKAQISKSQSSNILETFLNLLKEKSNYHIKISNFGTFSSHITPDRIGRNPKTKEVYEIKSRQKISFKPSIKVRNFLN